MQKVSASPDLSNLFWPLAGHHLALGSILAGRTPAAIYADDPAHPAVGLTWFHGRAFLCGQPGAADVEATGLVLREHLLPQALAAGQEAFILHFHPQGWAKHLETLLPGRQPIQAARQYYACTLLPRAIQPPPPGFEPLPADAALLDRLNPAGRAALEEEMVSERPSVADFLEKSFGVCLVRGDELVGWCLSEYNLDGRCEVGVATMEPYRQRGLGKWMTLALAAQALERGYHSLGWHCWLKNIPSAALARSAGFSYRHEEIVSVYRLA